MLIILLIVLIFYRVTAGLAPTRIYGRLMHLPPLYGIFQTGLWRDITIRQSGSLFPISGGSVLGKRTCGTDILIASAVKLLSNKTSLRKAGKQ
jgi:hypothetical protein